MVENSAQEMALRFIHASIGTVQVYAIQFSS